MAKAKFAPDQPETDLVIRDTSRHATQIIDHDAKPEAEDYAYLENVTPSRNALTGEVHGAPPAEEEPKETGKKDTLDKEAQAPPPEEPETVDWRERYENAQRKISEQGAELGTLRQIVDRHLVGGPKPPEVKPADEPQVPLIDRLLEKPEDVLRDIEDRAVQRAKTELRKEREQADTLKSLYDRHKDHAEVVASPEFREWVPKSGIPPSVLYLANGDPQRGIPGDPSTVAYILDTFKSSRKPAPPATAPATEKTVADITTKRRMAANAAGIGASSGNGDGKRVFTRAELFKLQQEDPQQYEVMQPEIVEAYREGRVR